MWPDNPPCFYKVSLKLSWGVRLKPAGSTVVRHKALVELSRLGRLQVKGWVRQPTETGTETNVRGDLAQQHDNTCSDSGSEVTDMLLPRWRKLWDTGESASARTKNSHKLQCTHLSQVSQSHTSFHGTHLTLSAAQSPEASSKRKAAESL